MCTGAHNLSGQMQYCVNRLNVVGMTVGWTFLL